MDGMKAADHQMALWSELNLQVYLLPEHNLLLAIVERAILDYVGKAKTQTHHRREAEKFFYCNERIPFSFRWICDHLPFDPEWFYRVIMTHVVREAEERRKEKVARRCGSVAIWKNGR
jgi:hypothetical protein